MQSWSGTPVSCRSSAGVHGPYPHTFSRGCLHCALGFCFAKCPRCRSNRLVNIGNYCVFISIRIPVSRWLSCVARTLLVFFYCVSRQPLSYCNYWNVLSRSSAPQFHRWVNIKRDWALPAASFCAISLCCRSFQLISVDLQFFRVWVACKLHYTFVLLHLSSFNALMVWCNRWIKFELNFK